MRRWRKMTWVLVLWCAVIIAWAVANGTGLGVVLILLIGFIGFVFFALVWLMTPAPQAAVSRLRRERQEGPHRMHEMRVRLGSRRTPGSGTLNGMGNTTDEEWNATITIAVAG